MLPKLGAVGTRSGKRWGGQGSEEDLQGRLSPGMDHTDQRREGGILHEDEGSCGRLQVMAGAK